MADGLDPALLTDLTRFAAQRPILVALDFDGVLAPIVDDPSQSRLDPLARAAIERLVTTDGVHVALVSGRQLEELRAVAAPPSGVELVGSHGAQVEHHDLVLTAEESASLALLTTALDELVARHPGTRAEHKPSTVVLHTRLAEPAVAAAATAEALDRFGAFDGVHALPGKDVVELSVVDADKGRAVARIAGDVGAQATLFAGDDVTDEFALRRLGPGDVGLKVGPGDTAARHRVASHEQIPDVLTTLADLL